MEICVAPLWILNYDKTYFPNDSLYYACQRRGDLKINTAVSLWAVGQNLDDVRNTNFGLLHISLGRYLAEGRGKHSPQIN